MSIIATKIGELYRNFVSLELKRRLNECPDVFLLNYKKLKSAEMTQLRKNLKSTGAEILVIKNSFMRKIFQETNRPAQAVSMIEGPTAVVFARKDPIATSRALVNFSKEHEALVINGGFMAERVVTSEDVKFISKLFSRQAVYQQVASTLNAPMGKLATSLHQIIAKVAYALKAVSDKKK